MTLSDYIGLKIQTMPDTYLYGTYEESFIAIMHDAVLELLSGNFTWANLKRESAGGYIYDPVLHDMLYPRKYYRYNPAYGLHVCRVKEELPYYFYPNTAYKHTVPGSNGWKIGVPDFFNRTEGAFTHVKDDSDRILKTFRYEYNKYHKLSAAFNNPVIQPDWRYGLLTYCYKVIQTLEIAHRSIAVELQIIDDEHIKALEQFFNVAISTLYPR